MNGRSVCDHTGIYNVRKCSLMNKDSTFYFSNLSLSLFFICFAFLDECLLRKSEFAKI